VTVTQWNKNGIAAASAPIAPTAGQALVGNGAVFTMTTVLTATTGWAQSGNAFGAVGVLGTTDAFDLNFITGGVSELYLNQSTGQAFFNSATVLHGSNAGIQYSHTTANRGQIRMNQYGNNTGVPGITCFKSRGATIGSTVSVSVGDVIGRITCIGISADNASLNLSSLLSFNVVQVTATKVSANMQVELTNLAGTRVVSMDLSTEGALSVLNGTVALPSYSFVADPDTGMYRASANTIGFAVGGISSLTLSSTELTVGGTGSNPNVVPFASVAADIGSAAAQWRDGYFNGFIRVNNLRDTAGTVRIELNGTAETIFRDNAGVIKMRVGSNGIELGDGAAILTTATVGQVKLPICAGPPTGVPGVGDGACVYDTFNNRIYVYNATVWRFVAVA